MDNAYHVIPVKMSALHEVYVQIHPRSVKQYKTMIRLKGKMLSYN